MNRILFVLLASFCFTVSQAQSVGKLYRYNNSSTWSHFYTTNWDELGNGKYSFRYENVTGFVYTKETAGAAPMHRYFNTSKKTHFYTMSWEELGQGNGTFKYEGIAFYAFKTQVPGSVPLYRYFHNNNKAHFYTANYAELGEGKGGYVKEGIAGYIFADESSAIAAAGSNKSDIVQIDAPLKDVADVKPSPAAAVSSTVDASSHFISVSGGDNYSNFSVEWKTALMNSALAFYNQGQPLMLIILPANGTKPPVPGTYPINEGSKRTNKKGSGVAKMELEPGFVSEGVQGTLTIEYRNELYWFSADNVKMYNPKTKETKTITLRFSMFIAQ